jgi:hypothetical protein
MQLTVTVYTQLLAQHQQTGALAMSKNLLGSAKSGLLFLKKN